jgi:hypothetical protein
MSIAGKNRCYCQAGRPKHRGKNDGDTSFVKEWLLVTLPDDLEWK